MILGLFYTISSPFLFVGLARIRVTRAPSQGPSHSSRQAPGPATPLASPSGQPPSSGPHSGPVAHTPARDTPTSLGPGPDPSQGRHGAAVRVRFSVSTLRKNRTGSESVWAGHAIMIMAEVSRKAAPYRHMCSSQRSPRVHYREFSDPSRVCPKFGDPLTKHPCPAASRYCRPLPLPRSASPSGGARRMKPVASPRSRGQ
jgi:hypothetical protein